MNNYLPLRYRLKIINKKNIEEDYLPTKYRLEINKRKKLKK